MVCQPTTFVRAFNENLGNWTENKHYRIARQFLKYRMPKSTCFFGTGGQILMAMVHFTFSFGLNTLLETCILLHLHLQINAQLWCQKNMKGPHLYNLIGVSM